MSARPAARGVCPTCGQVRPDVPPAATVTFEPPTATLTMNGREHWRARAERVKRWRRAASEAAEGVGALPPCVVEMAIPVRDRRRRDPHNWMPTVKACVDGLVDAGVWPDDDAEWVTVPEPTLVPGASDVIVSLRPR